MTDEQFNTLVQQRCNKIETILSKKAKEYARVDRLSNFKRAAQVLQCSPEFALISFWMKHIVSILDMVNDIEENNPDSSLALWDEKIGDAINYLILLEALIQDGR